LSSHCNTCKELSGGTFTLNQIIPKNALNITKGKDNLGKYTYYGDSGMHSLPKTLSTLLHTYTYTNVNASQARAFTATTAPIAPPTSTTIKK
jgi:hypothetical protein